MSGPPAPSAPAPLNVPRRPPSPAKLVSLASSPPLPIPTWGSPPTAYDLGERARGRAQEDRARGGGLDDDGRRRSSHGWGEVPLGTVVPQALFKIPQARSPPSKAPVSIHRLHNPAHRSSHDGQGQPTRHLQHGAPEPATSTRSQPRPQPPTARTTSTSRFASSSTRTPPGLFSTSLLNSPTSMPQDAVGLAPRLVPGMPDICAVCGVDDTPEWRKGPAGYRSLCNGCGIVYARRLKADEADGAVPASTVEEIERELEAIGLERFKKAQHRLPSGTRERILVTQERTRQPPTSQRPLKPRKGLRASQMLKNGQDVEQAHPPSSSATASASSQPSGREGSTKLERTALGVLLDFRRTSTPSISLAHYRSSIAPCSPPASTPRGRRSGSGEDSYFPSNVGSNGGSGLPPSSSYMLPLGGVGPASTFSFGRTPSPPPSSAKSVVTSTSAGERISIDVSPSKEAPSLFYKPPPVPSGLVRHSSPTLPAFDLDVVPTARSMYELAASANRMSIAYLTTSSARTPPLSVLSPPQALVSPGPGPWGRSSTTSTSTSAPGPAPSPVRWEAPQSVETRLERATSALRRRSSTIIGVKSPRRAAPTPPRAASPSLGRRATS